MNATRACILSSLFTLVALILFAYVAVSYCRVAWGPLLPEAGAPTATEVDPDDLPKPYAPADVEGTAVPPPDEEDEVDLPDLEPADVPPPPEKLEPWRDTSGQEEED